MENKEQIRDINQIINAPDGLISIKSSLTAKYNKKKNNKGFNEKDLIIVLSEYILAQLIISGTQIVIIGTPNPYNNSKRWEDVMIYYIDRFSETWKPFTEETVNNMMNEANYATKALKEQLAIRNYVNVYNNVREELVINTRDIDEVEEQRKQASGDYKIEKQFIVEKNIIKIVETLKKQPLPLVMLTELINLFEDQIEDKLNQSIIYNNEGIATNAAPIENVLAKFGLIKEKKNAMTKFNVHKDWDGIASGDYWDNTYVREDLEETRIGEVEFPELVEETIKLLLTFDLKLTPIAKEFAWFDAVIAKTIRKIRKSNFNTTDILQFSLGLKSLLGEHVEYLYNGLHLGIETKKVKEEPRGYIAHSNNFYFSREINGLTIEKRDSDYLLPYVKTSLSWGNKFDKTFNELYEWDNAGNKQEITNSFLEDFENSDSDLWKDNKFLNFISKYFVEQQSFAYALTLLLGDSLSVNRQEDQILFIWGEGKKGKTFFMSVVLGFFDGRIFFDRENQPKLIENYSDNGVVGRLNRLDDIKQEKYMAEFITNLMMIIEDNDNSKKLEGNLTSLLKTLSGGSKVSGRRMYKDKSEGLPAKPVIIANENVSIDIGADSGTKRRIRSFEFAPKTPTRVLSKNVLMKTVYTKAFFKGMLEVIFKLMSIAKWELPYKDSDITQAEHLNELLEKGTKRNQIKSNKELDVIAFFFQSILKEVENESSTDDIIVVIQQPVRDTATINAGDFKGKNAGLITFKFVDNRYIIDELLFVENHIAKVISYEGSTLKELQNFFSGAATYQSTNVKKRVDKRTHNARWLIRTRNEVVEPVIEIETNHISNNRRSVYYKIKPSILAQMNEKAFGGNNDD